MKGSSEVIMGATLVMAATLAIVLGLVVVLLAELYCSLLLRRRPTICNPDSSSTPATVVSATPVTTASPASNNAFQPDDHDRPPATSPLSSFYSHGVLRAPRSLLFPALSYYPESDVHHYLRHAPPMTTTEFVSVTVPEHDSDPENHLMYISNPVYDAGGKSGHLGTTTPPFETPDSSPSRLEEEEAVAASSSSSSPPSDHKSVERVVDVECAATIVVTPPVTPMKKLPAVVACSVALRDVRSMCTSCSDTNTNLGLLSSSSATPSTSPSW